MIIMQKGLLIICYTLFFFFTDSAANPFYELVIFVNGEIRSDASHLTEGDTVLILFRNVGLHINRSPPCSDRLFTTKQRAGCVVIQDLCVTNNPHFKHPHAFTLLYYFRPVMPRDSGLIINFSDVTGKAASVSVTLGGKCYNSQITDPMFIFP